MVSMERVPRLGDRDWYSAKEVAERLSGPGVFVSLRSVYRHRDRLGVLLAGASTRQAHRFPKAAIDPLARKGIPPAPMAAAHPTRPANSRSSPITGTTMDPTGFMAVFTQMRLEIHEKDGEIRRLLSERSEMARAMQRADDRNGQLESQLASLRSHYEDLLTIARRVAREDSEVMDQLHTKSPNG